MKNKDLPKFKLGDEVKWSSQSAGVLKSKQGYVAKIIPAGTKVSYPMLKNDGDPRDHESYIVLVGEKPYWPRVVHLKKVTNKS